MNEDDLKLFTALLNTGHAHAGVTGATQSGAADALRRLVDRHYPAPLYVAPRTGMSTSLVLPDLLDFGKKKR